MLRHERRLLIDCLGIGVALTLLVVAADASGILHRFDEFLYDLRARTCQFFTPPPTDMLVHLDIDDPAIETIGALPWPRATLARLLDEVRLAGPKAVELDLLFSERQRVEWVPHAGHQTVATPHAPASGAPSQSDDSFTVLDHDAELADAIRRLGNVIIPANFHAVPARTPLFAAMVNVLRKDPSLDASAVADQLREDGVAVPPTELGDEFFAARREAIDIRLRELNVAPESSFDHVRLALLPSTPSEVRTGAVSVLEEQWQKHLAARAFCRFAWPKPQGMRSYGEVRVQLAPVQKLADAADAGAFVDYTQFGSPVIRTLPLLLEADGNVYPQMGLALAAKMLDVDVTGARMIGDRLVLPREAGKELIIPLAPSRVSTDGGIYGNLLPIPWFGGRQWQNMYDWPNQRTSRQHVPMNQVWQAALARRKIERNNETVDEAIRSLFAAMKDAVRLERYTSTRPAVEDFASREAMIRALLDEFAPFVEQQKNLNPADLADDERALFASITAIRQVLEHTPALVNDLARYRAVLREKLGDKAVLVGWTATGAIADFVPTSLHEKCPGVVVHGVIFNGIMTGHLWRTAPWWIASLTTLVMGSLISFTTARLSPLKALLVASMLAGAFTLVNGIVLFDYADTIMSAAGPLVVVAMTWSACTLTRVIIEQAERSRITRRFSNYVDPKIVSYVMENPDVSFDGETREMTVVFTDLAGFTAISERLGEKVVPMLNELFGQLVPVIRRHEGTLNKFLGDGIMFFFNAPRRQASHAAIAVATVLEMNEKLAVFNEQLRGQGLPQLTMRAGIMTAEMIVGDAGGAGAADYTVLGDAVNTGSRLEAANKAIGTRTLISARTVEMLNGEFLIRPIGRLKVVGKDEAVMVYEPLARCEAATDAQRELAKCTEELVESYAQQRFADTISLADALEDRFGESKLASMYRDLAKRYRDAPPAEPFDSRIELTQK